MKRNQYIHYGNTKFNPEQFQPIKNKTMLSKPLGGLWASNINSKYGWKQWCLDNDFHLNKLNENFQFYIKENANILFIESEKQLDSLPHANIDYPLLSWHCLDFEALLKSGVDAIEIDISGEGLYFGLYGWDCDSILIMNKDIIIPCQNMYIMGDKQ